MDDWFEWFNPATYGTDERDPMRFGDNDPSRYYQEMGINAPSTRYDDGAIDYGRLSGQPVIRARPKDINGVEYHELAAFDANGNQVGNSTYTENMRHGWNTEWLRLAAPLITAGAASIAGTAGAAAGTAGSAGGSGTAGATAGTAASSSPDMFSQWLNTGATDASTFGGFGGGAGSVGAGSAAAAAQAAAGGGGFNVATGGGSGDPSAFVTDGYTGGVPSLAGGGIGGGAGMTGSFGGYGDWIQLGGSLLNGYLGQRAADKAAGAQVDAANAASKVQWDMFNQIRQDNMPALQARNAGLTGYQNLLKNPGSITQDPGYQFGLDQGTKAIGSNAASKGSYYSGATLKALNKFGQDYGGTKFNEALNRHGNLAGMGQLGTSQIGGAGQNAANQVGQNMIGAGNARGAASLAGANSWQNALNGLISYGNQKNWWEG